MELTYASVAVAVISLLVNLFLIWDRRKLKSFDIDKKLELLEIQENEVKLKYNDKRKSNDNNLIAKGLFHSGIRVCKLEELEAEEKRELGKLNIEKNHLLKLKSYKFLGIRM